MKKVLSYLLAGAMLLSMAAPTFAADTDSRKIYVSAVNGDDTNNGTSMSQAVKTVEQAQVLARLSAQSEDKKIEIIFEEGVYELDSALTLTAEDSGVSADLPVVYRAYSGKEVSFTRAKKIDADKFTLTDNETIQEAVRGNVYEADISDFTALKGGLHEVLYQAGEMGEVAQWTGELEQVGKADGNDMAYTFHIPTEKIGIWTSDLTNVYASGWTTGWSHSIAAVKDIDATVTNANDGDKVVENTIYVPFYSDDTLQTLLNILPELDEQGEYYVDAANKKLYYYPLGGSLEDIYLADNRDPDNRWNGDTTAIVNMSGAEHIRFEGIDFFATGGRAFHMENCNDVVIYDTTMKAIGWEGVYATNTTSLKILSSTFSDMQSGVLSISGGTKSDLTASENEVVNCNIYDVAILYKTGISLAGVSGAAIYLNGVGTTVKNNEISYTPYMAISIDGNNHLIEGNRIRNAAAETFDNAVIYAGRSHLDRGTVIKGNYIFWDKTMEDYANIVNEHYVGVTADSDTQAIYFDDLQSGMTATGNVIYNMPRAFLLGGGRDNTVTDNAVIDCRRGVFHDVEGSYAEGYRTQHIDPEGTAGGNIYKEMSSFLASDYDEAAWTDAYGDAFTTLVSDFTTYKTGYDALEKDEDGNAVDQDAKLALLAVYGKVKNSTMENNLYTGPWAQSWDWNDSYDVRSVWAANNNTTVDTYVKPWYNQISPSLDFADFNALANATAVGKTEQMYSGILSSDSLAGVSIDETTYDITIANAEDGVPTSTAEMGIGVDTYQATVDTNEVDASDSNRFTAIVAIYNGDGVLKAVQMQDEVFLYNGQTEDITIDVPEDADSTWTGKLMLWNVATMRPILEEVYQLAN